MIFKNQTHKYIRSWNIGHYLIFAPGLIVMLIGAMTDLYETKIGVIIMLAIWFIGGRTCCTHIRGRGRTN